MKIGLEIQGGEKKGAKIRVPKGIRPTQSLVKRSVFDRLGDWIQGKRVLELYAGSGAVGFEALSRGAQAVVFVERARNAVLSIKENTEKLRYTDKVEIIQRESTRALRKFIETGRKFDLVFADPPYGSTQIEVLLELAPLVMEEGGILILQTQKQQELQETKGLCQEKEVQFGDTKVSFHRRVSG